MKENVDEAQHKERIEVFRLNSIDGSRRSLTFCVYIFDAVYRIFMNFRLFSM